jgi:hypothetical protein
VKPSWPASFCALETCNEQMIKEADIKLFKVNLDSITGGRGECSWVVKTSHLLAACKAKFDFSPL